MLLIARYVFDVNYVTVVEPTVTITGVVAVDNVKFTAIYERGTDFVLILKILSLFFFCFSPCYSCRFCTAGVAAAPFSCCLSATIPFLTDKISVMTESYWITDYTWLGAPNIQLSLSATVALYDFRHTFSPLWNIYWCGSSFYLTRGRRLFYTPVFW